MGVIVVGLGVLVYLQLRPAPDVPHYASDGDAEFASPAIDSGACIEIEVLRAQIEALGVQIERLEHRIAENRGPTSTGPADGVQEQASSSPMAMTRSVDHMHRSF